MFLLAIVFIAGGFCMLWLSSFKLPDLGDLQKREITQSTKIYDRTGQVLFV